VFYHLHKKLWNITHYASVQIVAVQGYQCSYCSKYYPSERLLRDHMRHHVNQYKCSFCDMTCPTPSSLSVHIRYRHLDSKPFKCDFCEYTWVNPSHLRKTIPCEVSVHPDEFQNSTVIYWKVRYRTLNICNIHDHLHISYDAPYCRHLE